MDTPIDIRMLKEGDSVKGAPVDICPICRKNGVYLTDGRGKTLIAHMANIKNDHWEIIMECEFGVTVGIG